MWVQSLCREDPLENGMATHSSVLAWEIPWTEEPSRLQSMRSQRVRHDLLTTPTAHKHAAIQMRRRSHSLEAEHHRVILGLLSQNTIDCVASTTETYFFPSLEARTTRSRSSRVSCPWGLSSCLLTVFSNGSESHLRHCDGLLFRYWNQHESPSLMTSLNISYLSKVPSPNCTTLRVKASTHEFGGTNRLSP